MDFKNIDKSISQIIEKKIALSKLTYDDKQYDKIEEQLHDLEDDFVEKFGDYFEEILENIHASVCPETDVLLPTAYLANHYIEKGKNSDGTIAYDVNYKEGVWVDAEKYPGMDTRLVLIPNPTRIILSVNGKGKQTVWEATNSKSSS